MWVGRYCSTALPIKETANPEPALVTKVPAPHRLPPKHHAYLEPPLLSR